MFVEIKNGSKRRIALECASCTGPSGLAIARALLVVPKSSPIAFPKTVASLRTEPWRWRAIVPATEIRSLTLGKEFLKQRRKVGPLAQFICGQFFGGCGWILSTSA